MFFDRVVAPVLGLFSPTRQPVEGASGGAEPEVQHAPQPRGQTLLCRGSNEPFRDAQDCAPILSAASKCTLQRKPEVS